MRFSSIQLAGYGHFDSRRFAFPRADGAPDIHLVIGENEAGKTTLKHALVDVLFGFPARSPYAFREGRPSIAAEIEVCGTRLTFEREAGRRKPRPAEAAAVLDEALRGLDAAAFLATQAFSHDEMREHARLLHESRGDLKDLLMRDAGGLSEAVTLLDALREESGKLFKTDGRSRNNDFRVAENAFNDAMRTARGLDATEHRALIAAREEAEGALVRVRRLCAEAKERAGRLERERRAERIAERLEALEAQLAALPDIRLPPGAVERVGQAALAEAAARTALEGAGERRAELERRLRAVPLDEAAVALGAEIDDLAARLAELSLRARERLERGAEADAAEAAALDRARDIGLSAACPAALARALPAAVDRLEADRHMRARAKLALDAEKCREALEEAVATPPPEIPAGPSEALLAALGCVADLGRYREAWQAAVAKVEDAEEAMRRAEADSAADGDCDAPPPPEEGAAAEAAIEAAKRAFEDAEGRVDRAAEEVRRREGEARRAAAGEVPTAPVLAAAREDRDALWREFLRGRPLAEGREEYERRVAEADRIADVRFERSRESLAAESAERELAAARKELADCVAARDRRREALEEARARWAERLAAAGLATVPADYRAWHARRTARREAAHALAKAREAQDALRRRLMEAARDCHAALGRKIADGLDGDALLAAVETAAAAAKAERERLENAVAEARAAAKAHAERERDRPRRERALADAEAALAAWGEAWRPLAARCGVPEEIAAERLADILHGHAEIERLLQKAAECRRAVAATDAFEEALVRDVARLSRALGVPAGEDVRAAGRALVDRFAAARKAAEEAERLGHELEAARKDEAKAGEALDDARRAMKPDREAAGLPPGAPVAALADAARASDERHAVEKRLADARNDLAAEGFAWPAAWDALAAMTAAEREAAAEAAREEAERLGREVEAAIAEATRARGELERAEAEARGGAADAARARFEAGVHARAMAEAAAEAVRRRLEIAVLSAARDAFEAENRSPILDRASVVFATFTGGGFDRLERGWTAGQSFVRAHRAGGCEVLDVAALSDGTRDQLVASVRIAAAEESPLPFIADDLFVNADDERAGNGFRVLAGLARGRQVIYLTHHAHLEAVARAAVGEGLSVLRL